MLVFACMLLDLERLVVKPCKILGLGLVTVLSLEWVVCICINCELIDFLAVDLIGCGV
jgi:hypothetical protein